MSKIGGLLPASEEEFNYFKEVMIKVNPEFKLVYWSSPEGVAQQVATIFKVPAKELDIYVFNKIKEEAVRIDTERAVRESLENDFSIINNTDIELIQAFDKKWPWIVIRIAFNYIVHIILSLVCMILLYSFHLFGWFILGIMVLFVISWKVKQINYVISNWLARSMGTTPRW